MNKEVIKVLKKELKKWKKDNLLTWGNMQKHSIKKAPLLFPVGWGVVYKMLMKDGKKVHPNRLKVLMDHFGIPCEQQYGIIHITEKSEEDEE